MSESPITSLQAESSTHFKATQRVRWAEIGLGVAGVSASVMHEGLLNVTRVQNIELGIIVIAALLVSTVGMALRFFWVNDKQSFLSDQRSPIVLNIIWLFLVLVILVNGPILHMVRSSRFNDILLISEIVLVLRGVLVLLLLTRTATAKNINPAIILVTTFLFLITIGTLLLMLPKARMQNSPDGSELRAPFEVALFTATSASCVTGLVVEPTGTYWSRTGQVIILFLFQVGGLGIMTCGAFFAVLAGRNIPIKESATLNEVLESDQLGNLRQILLAIITMTFLCEFAGAVFISGLWSDLPLSDQIFYTVFHAVSAFCNAGFSLTENSFVGMSTRWQVWLVITSLIVIGSLGFAVLYNLALFFRSRIGTIEWKPLFNLRRDRVRLSITSRIVLITSAVLLLTGFMVYFLLESTSGEINNLPLTQRLADSWFQSVTFRTAGFNTTDHGSMQPATKLFAIGLMFIGASPGSTGGGVKTVCFALTVLSLISILRGRQRVEIWGRTISNVLVKRAFTIMVLGIVVVMSTTFLLVFFEQNEARFLDHLFEATSAFATVGVSTGITADLSLPSKYVVIVTMFLGRIGPLTLLVALAGRMKDARYEYPVERVTLG